MDWSPHLNPAPWRDEDQQHRRAVERPLASGIGAALRSNFRVAPIPADLQAVLDKLR